VRIFGSGEPELLFLLGPDHRQTSGEPGDGQIGGSPIFSDLLRGVVATTSKQGHGALTGDYVGPEASAKVVIGVGAAALVGGSQNTISLQPLNVEGGGGIGFTAGVENLTLVYVSDSPAPKMRYKHHPDAMRR
jgi:hypothetical protein